MALALFLRNWPNDMTKMAAQVPAMFEALSGMNMADLFSNIRTIAQKPGALPPTTGDGKSDAAASGK